MNGHNLLTIDALTHADNFKNLIFKIKNCDIKRAIIYLEQHGYTHKDRYIIVSNIVDGFENWIYTNTKGEINITPDPQKHINLVLSGYNETSLLKYGMFKDKDGNDIYVDNFLLYVEAKCDNPTAQCILKVVKDKQTDKLKLTTILYNADGDYKWAPRTPENNNDIELVNYTNEDGNFIDLKVLDVLSNELTISYAAKHWPLSDKCVTTIKIGDTVNVSFNNAQHTLHEKAEVLYIPHATGDSWRFKDLESGEISYVSELCTVIKL